MDNGLEPPLPRRLPKKKSYKLLKTVLTLAGIAAPIYYFAAMPKLPRVPLGRDAVTTRAFADPNGKDACTLPEGSHVVIMNGWYKDDGENRWSTAKDKYGRPEVGEYTVVIPITTQRAHNSCLHTAQMEPRDVYVDPDYRRTHHKEVFGADPVKSTASSVTPPERVDPKPSPLGTQPAGSH